MSTHPLRVCLLTGGGDAPGLNAAVRAFVHVATRRKVLVSASRYGFEGLLGTDGVMPLRLEDVRGILQLGGSILGCSTRSNPFAPGAMPDLERKVVGRLREHGVEALVLAGGDGTMSIARRLMEHGLPCVGIPKTIDADLGGTAATIGTDTAVETVTHALDALHATAEAHQRVMVVEVMGRHAGWIALRAGIAGGADAILIPEISYEPSRVAAKIQEREAIGRRFSIVVVGEGARPVNGGESEVEPAHEGHLARLGGAGQRLATELAACGVAHEIRVTVLGHLQRGGSPTATDRLLGTRLGAHAAGLCATRRFGRMVCVHGGRVDSITLDEACAAVARVDPRGELISCARSLGIEMGAE